MGYIMDLRKYVGHRTLLMPAATVIIYDGDNVLLQKRADDHKWALHGGSIELDEECVNAMKREVKEELGIDVLDEKLLNVYSGEKYHHIYPNGDEVSIIDIVYYSNNYSGDISFNDGEVLEVKWFNKNNLPDNMFLYNKEYILDLYKKLGEKNV